MVKFANVECGELKVKNLKNLNYCLNVVITETSCVFIIRLIFLSGYLSSCIFSYIKSQLGKWNRNSYWMKWGKTKSGLYSYQSNYYNLIAGIEFDADNRKLVLTITTFLANFPAPEYDLQMSYKFCMTKLYLNWIFFFMRVLNCRFATELWLFHVEKDQLFSAYLGGCRSESIRDWCFAQNGIIKLFAGNNSKSR